MRRKELQAASRSVVEHLISRNNDIGGYWGIGVLCQLGELKGKSSFWFRIRKAMPTGVFGCELTRSGDFAAKLFSQESSMSVNCQISYFIDGSFPNTRVRYICTIAASATFQGRSGLFASNINCWSHDSFLERKSSAYFSRPP